MVELDFPKILIWEYNNINVSVTYGTKEDVISLEEDRDGQ